MIELLLGQLAQIGVGGTVDQRLGFVQFLLDFFVRSERRDDIFKLALLARDLLQTEMVGRHVGLRHQFRQLIVARLNTG